MITVLRAPPFATVQDQGWPRGRAIGLPPGGAMDREMLTLANLLVGNSETAAGLEWALGPGSLRFETATRIALAGDGTIAGRAAWTGFEVRAGEELTIAPGPRERFVYLAVSGGIDTTPISGSRSTYLPAALGGMEGRRLRTGDRIAVGPRDSARVPVAAVAPLDRSGANAVRIMRGPQLERFGDDAWDQLLESEWRVLPASDRMGYRLAGPAITPRDRATLPSEAACPGAFQVPDGGQPIVLMPDGPTVGGYPKLAVVARVDLPLLAQSPPGRVIRFREIWPEEAREALRRRARELRELAQSGG